MLAARRRHALDSTLSASQVSVVQVLALQGQNPVSFVSGTTIHDGTIVLTFAHCVVPGMQMSIADPANPGQAVFGNVIFADPNADIALLQFPNQIGSAAALSNCAQVAIGNGAFVVGFPMGIVEKTLLSAHIASMTADSLRIDASVNHGNSGGPLFDLQGNQIGVVNAKHGSLSQIKNAQPMAMMSIGGIDPVKAIQLLIEEMQKNLNLGIGYAIKNDVIKGPTSYIGASIP